MRANMSVLLPSVDATPDLRAQHLVVGVVSVINQKRDTKK